MATIQERRQHVVNEAYFFVSHRLPIALEAKKRGFEVHVAAPRDHVGQQGFEAVDRAHQVQLGELAEVGGREPCGAHRPVGAGVEHGLIDRAQRLFDGRDRRRDGRRVGHVERKGVDLALQGPGALRQFGQGTGAAGRGCHAPAVRRHPPRQGMAQSRARARDPGAARNALSRRHRSFVEPSISASAAAFPRRA